MVFGSVGMLAATRLTHLAGYAAILSSGTLLAATGFGQITLTAGLLYYLPSSTLAVAILFLLADAIDRWRNDGSSFADWDDEQAPFLSAELIPAQHINLDENEQALIGRPIPAATVFLGLAFLLCTLVVAGLPPLSGFLGKFAMLTALLNPLGLGTDHQPAMPAAGWGLLALMIGSGLLALIALTRAGIRLFWASHERSNPEIRLAEGVPIAALMGLCIALTVQAQDAMRYTTATASALLQPQGYIQSVLGTMPVAAPEATPQELP